MFIDFATPFTDLSDQFLLVIQELRKSPTFAPSYIAEIKKVVIPVAPACEGTQCNRCHSPMVVHDPQHMYDEVIHICKESMVVKKAEDAKDAEDAEDDIEQIMDELEEYEYNDYIDYMLDNDYDY